MLTAQHTAEYPLSTGSSLLTSIANQIFHLLNGLINGHTMLTTRIMNDINGLTTVAITFKKPDLR